MTGVFHEIAEPERLVFTGTALDAKGEPLFDVLNTVTFIENGGRTTLTLQATVGKTSQAAAPYIAGMEQGWTQSLERLAEELAS